MKSLLVLAFVLFGISNLAAQSSNAPGEPAYAVTWQDDEGSWFAVGPVQALWSGEETEEKALDYVIGSKTKKAGKMKKIKTCGKFTVYSLGVDYESYDTNAIKYARKKGYDCKDPE